MFPRHKFFIICYGIILVLIIIWLLLKVQFVFQPIIIAVQTLFIPFLLAGVLFYLFRPLVDLLGRWRVPRGISILFLYLLFIGGLSLAIFMVGPILQEQVNRLFSNAPQMLDSLLEQFTIVQEFIENNEYAQNAVDSAIDWLEGSLNNIVSNISAVISTITSFVITLVVVPFILFYLLKDGRKAPQQVLRLLPTSQSNEATRILGDMNRALSTYVQGQIVVSLCVGVMVYIGYLIIGLEYSLVLAIVAMVTNVIPFVGPFIGTFPAVIVGLIDSPFMMVKVLIVVVVAQQIESNVISPQVMGRVLDVHPLTIILLLLVAGSIAGLFGLILAVPTYAVAKVIVQHTHRLIRLRYASEQNK